VFAFLVECCVAATIKLAMLHITSKTPDRKKCKLTNHKVQLGAVSAVRLKVLTIKVGQNK